MRLRSVLVLSAVVVIASLASRASHAGAEPTHRLALDLSGARLGLVVAHAQDAQLVLATPDVTPALATLVGSFTRGAPVKRDVRLATGALVKKTNDARLAAVKLPAIGHGGVPEVELVFTAAPLVTQPVLSAKEAPPPPPAARIAAFRLDIAGITATDLPKLDALTLTQKSDGTTTAGPVAFEAGAGGAAPFVTWQRSQAGHPAPRAVHVEYVGADGVSVLRLDLDRCTPSSVVPQGASGTTRVVLACGKVTAP